MCIGVLRSSSVGVPSSAAPQAAPLLPAETLWAPIAVASGAEGAAADCGDPEASDATVIIVVAARPSTAPMAALELAVTAPPLAAATAEAGNSALGVDVSSKTLWLPPNKADNEGPFASSAVAPPPTSPPAIPLARLRSRLDTFRCCCEAAVGFVATLVEALAPLAVEALAPTGPPLPLRCCCCCCCCRRCLWRL